MRFAAGLRESLQIRGTQAPVELTRGDGLEEVLSRHLLAVEEMTYGDLFTSVLLLRPDGKRLSHGAAPRLPKSYREAIDGAEIGPCAGSCGTAAFFGRPVYVTDIATDPLWADYRHLALPHGFRSCWSTPIRDKLGSVIGTFAIYHMTVGSPSREEIEAIELITAQVADAIMWDRVVGEFARSRSATDPFELGFDISDESWADDAIASWRTRLLKKLQRLEGLAAELKLEAETAASEELRNGMRAASVECRRLISFLRLRIDFDASTRH
jgi:hypothetical protein